MPNRFATLFEDDLVEHGSVIDRADNDWLDRVGLVAAVVCIFFLLLIGFLAVRSWSSYSDANLIQFRGAKAGQLQPGALVVMDDVEVGLVKSVTIEDGRAVANLQFNDKVVNQIPAGSRFIVRSLNSIMPGNVGVEIVSADSTPEFRDQRSVASLDGLGRDTETSVEIFPTAIPRGLYLLIAAIGIFVAIVFGISWKVARTKWLRFALLVGSFVVIVYLLQRGIIASDAVQQLFDWASNTIRGSVNGQSS